MNLMEGIRATGVTIMMITHDMRLVQEYAQRVIVMSEGEITYTGNPADLFSSSDLLKAANLCPTLLQELLATYGKSGRHVGCSIRTSEEFLDALAFSRVEEEKHGIH
jgi:energy-coupling factor transport system ATP-binding protein